MVTLKVESVISISTDTSEIDSLSVFARRYIPYGSLAGAIIFFIFCIWVEENTLSSAIQSSIFFGIILFAQAKSIVLIQIKLKNKKYRAVNFSGIIQNSATAIRQVLLGLFNPLAIYLQVGYVIGRIAGLLSLRPTGRKKINNLNKTQPLIRESWLIFVRSKYFIGANFCEAAIVGTPLLLLSTFFGKDTAGYYGLIQSLLIVPVNLTTSAFAAVAFSNIAKESESSDLTKKIHKKNLIDSFAKPLLLTGLLFVPVSLFLMEPILKIFVNDKWNSMYSVLPCIIVSVGLNFIWFPLINLLNLEGELKMAFYGTFGRFFVALFFSVICIGLDKSWTFSINVFLISQVVFQIAWIVHVIKATRIFSF
jgi:O-antigen/teichoic acid export membrane protein